MNEIGTDQDRKWYETAFEELYPTIYPHRDDDSAEREIHALVRALGLTGCTGKVLDLCCGAGRHASALSRMGFTVLGVDLSPYLLGQAGARPDLTGLLARADMIALPFRPGFGLVLNLFSSFGYFMDERKNEHVLCEIFRVLVPGGCLVLDHMNRSHVENNLVPVDSVERNSALIRQRRRIEGSRVIKEIEVHMKNGESARFFESVRMYTPNEMKNVLLSAGFGSVRLFGGFDGESLTEASSRMIVFAEKAGVEP